MSKILLVEDNDINRDMLFRRLEGKGYEVIVAVNGEEAIAKTYSNQPDLVLMDLNLPILDGWEASRQLKAAPQTRVIPIIALTADVLAGEREKALAAGCDEYETKPINFPQLLKKINNLLASTAPVTKSHLSDTLNLPRDHDPRLQPVLRIYLRREFDPAIYSIIGYSELLLDIFKEQQHQNYSETEQPDVGQQKNLYSDLHKLLTSGTQLLKLLHAILNPILLEIQQMTIDLVAPALRRELLTPLSTIIGYCEILLEEAPSNLHPDLEQIYVLAKDLLSKVNDLDNLVKHHLNSIQIPNLDGHCVNEPHTLLEIRTDTHRSLVSTKTDMNARVLVIDNDELNCVFLSRYLEHQGIQVKIAMTSQQALHAMNVLPYDLIFLSLNVLEMGRLTLLEQIMCHQEWQNVPILLMAAPDEMGLVAQGIAMGATDYLTRPFQSIILRTKIIDCLERKNLRDQQQKLVSLQSELMKVKQAQQTAGIVQTDYFQQLQPDTESEGNEEASQTVDLPPTVLLVEDNELNCDMLSRRLQRAGYNVVIASDGADGVAKAVSEQPHIILMDISLPVMDGWEATQHLKANAETCQIPIIALTAHAMAGDREKSLAAGCDDYDTKPVNLPRLLSKIGEHLKCRTDE